MESSLEKKWYVILTKPRQERTAEKHLARQGFEVYLPVLQQRIRRRNKWVYCLHPMFPRYIFIGVAPATQSLAPVRSTFGVSQLVCFGTSVAEIPTELITELQGRESSDRSDQECNTFPRIGDKVEIVKGPFAGLVAQLRTSPASDRVEVLLSLLGRKNLVTVPADSLAPCQPS